ncbi:hypothetical protein Atai01_74270 [Amycolatopsis taiwanensis]|uniref:Tyr recombinase domain-containing protein n=1 Tax=Amycolatopsis taiwanensis TaxID=342230 RepID=A0A9W6VGH6_9PSEU|nr:hypothetical protein Atai01_74270 [Amycolatopsis taiwanensis]
MLGLAARYDPISINPTRGTRRILVGQTKQPCALAPMERTQWLAQLESNEKAVRWGLPDLSKFMMATGVRIGEALGVFWEDIDFEAGTVDVAHTVVRIKGKGLYRKPKPKTKKSERLLPLPSWALVMLEKRLAEAMEEGRSMSSPVFASSLGGLRDPSKRASRDPGDEGTGGVHVRHLAHLPEDDGDRPRRRERADPAHRRTPRPRQGVHDPGRVPWPEVGQPGHCGGSRRTAG